MIKITKNTIIEIAIVIVLATILSLLYNFIRTDSIPFFPKPKEDLLVNDAELFGSNDSTEQFANQTALLQDTTVADSAMQVADTTAFADTIATPKDTITDNFETLLQNAKKSSFGEYPIINYEQMKKISSDKSGKFLIIDARRAEPYSKQHIGNAMNICPYDSAEVVMGKIAALPSDKIIIVYCDGGDCDSSHEIANLLQQMGFKRFYIYEGG